MDSYITHLTGSLQNHLTGFNMHNEPARMCRNILIVEPGMELSAPYIYVGTLSDTRKVMRQFHAPSDTCFFISDPEGRDASSLPGYLNYFISDLPLVQLYNQISIAFEQFIQHKDESEIDIHNFKSLINGKLREEDAVHRVLTSVIDEVQEHYSIIVTFFEEVPADNVIERCISTFDRMLTHSFSFVEGSRIITFFMHRDRFVSFPAKLREDLEQIAEDMDAYCTVSTNARRHSMIRETYEMTNGTTDLIAGMNLLKENRVFLLDEYKDFFVLDLCRRQFEQLFDNHDLLYLCNPSVIALRRYDKEHRTDYCDTLFQYLSNDRSITRTAEVMFAHRNTIQNKLKKITKIIGDDLEDSKTRFNIILSFNLLFYYERYLGETMRL